MWKHTQKFEYEQFRQSKIEQGKRKDPTEIEDTTIKTIETSKTQIQNL